MKKIFIGIACLLVFLTGLPLAACDITYVINEHDDYGSFMAGMGYEIITCTIKLRKEAFDEMLFTIHKFGTFKNKIEATLSWYSNSPVDKKLEFRFGEKRPGGKFNQDITDDLWRYTYSDKKQKPKIRYFSRTSIRFDAAELEKYTRSKDPEKYLTVIQITPDPQWWIGKKEEKIRIPINEGHIKWLNEFFVHMHAMDKNDMSMLEKAQKKPDKKSHKH